MPSIFELLFCGHLYSTLWNQIILEFNMNQENSRLTDYNLFKLETGWKTKKKYIYVLVHTHTHTHKHTHWNYKTVVLIIVIVIVI